MDTEFVRIAHTDDFKSRWLAAATDVVGSTPEELARYQLAEIEKYRKIALAAGIKAD